MHQAAQPFLLQADVEVDAVGPHVHVVPVGQVALAKACCSACHWAVSRVITDADSPAAEPKNPSSAGAKSPARHAVQVHQRQHLGHLRALAAPRRQDHAAEPEPLAGVRSTRRSFTLGARRPRSHPRRSGSCAGPACPLRTTSRWPRSSPLAGQRGDVGIHLGLQRGGQHPAGTLADHLVQVAGAARPAPRRRSLLSTSAFLPRRRCRAGASVLVNEEGTPRSHLQTRSTSSGHTSFIRYGKCSCRGLVSVRGRAY